MVESDLRLYVRALAFAAAKHRDQRRKDREGTPYINHPIALTEILNVEVGITDPFVLVAALLHDTVEDTATTADELAEHFSPEIRDIVLEVSDDKRLNKARRKQLQIEHAPDLSQPARLVKLADKISNLRDLHSSPPHGWCLERKREYFDWCKAVIDGLRGTHTMLEEIFDEIYRSRP